MISLILGAIFFGQEHTTAGVTSINGALFLMIANINNMLISVVNVFCMELPIFLREHFNGMYRADVYFLSKQLAELPVFLIQPALNVGILYFMVGLNPALERFLLTLGVSEILAQTNVSFGRNKLDSPEAFIVDCRILVASDMLLVAPCCASSNRSELILLAW